MHRPTPRPILPILALLAACGEQPRATVPLVPPAAPRAAYSSSPACEREDARLLRRDIGSLFSSAKLRQTARSHEEVVEERCTSPFPQPYPGTTASQSLASAPAAALTYVEWLLAQRGAPGMSSDDELLWSHLVRLFRYVGYTLPSGGAGFTGGLGASGFAKVCFSDAECTAIAPDERRGIRFPAGALSDQPGIPFLVTGIPADCGPFTAASYTPYGACLDISADPKPARSFPLQKKAIVEMCAAEGTPSYIWKRREDVFTGTTTTQGKIGQRSMDPSGAYKALSLRPYAQGFLNPLKCDDVPPPSSASGAAGLLRRAGHSLAALFAPKIAYAGHGGLGTLPGFTDEELSLFGPLDGYAFNGDFEPDTVGTFPGRWPEMRNGTWTLSTGPSPSRASVQLGGAFGSRHLVLDQGGGNASNKDPLTFIGTLGQAMAPSVADPDRAVRLRFRAAVLTTRAQNARFVVSTSTGETIASLVFRDGSRAQAGSIAVLDPTTGLAIGTGAVWEQSAVSPFEVTIAFDRANGTAAISVGLAAQPPLASYTLPMSTIADLGSFRWVLDGKDGVTIGSDDYQAFDVTPAP